MRIQNKFFSMDHFSRITETTENRIIALIISITPNIKQPTPMSAILVTISLVSENNCNVQIVKNIPKNKKIIPGSP